jgi:hypothetical protein
LGIAIRVWSIGHSLHAEHTIKHITGEEPEWMWLGERRSFNVTLDSEDNVISIKPNKVNDWRVDMCKRHNKLGQWVGHNVYKGKDKNGNDIDEDIISDTEYFLADE